MTLPPAVQVALFGLGWSGAVGLAGLLALRFLPRRSVRTDLAGVAAVAVGSLVAGLVGAAQAMFLSDHDLTVVAQIAVVVTPIALGVAVAAGRTVVRDVAGLRTRAAALAHLDASTASGAGRGRPRLAELAAIDDDLTEAADRLTRGRIQRDALERSRRELVAWVSHDLRTPLAGIRAMAEALEDGVAAHPDVYLRRILHEVDRVGLLVDDLFELSRIQAGALTLDPLTVDLAELAHDAVDVVAPAARRRGVRVELAPLHGMSPVRVDPRTVTRVLSNLVANAVHYSPAGGRVLVDVAACDGRVVVGVEDCCGGIPAEDVARLFEPGWRANRSRTPASDVGGGLGLAIARGLARANGGEVDVTPRCGAGCRFELALPAAR
ncbi:cell wall metabolism sensor histidine kinase WalK [Kineosporia sp. A_224]|uniref:sensor histidine kinase n=1 Tax=Kineosporia sp. A_224 TaxID=1962180 RepID=UPI0018E97EEA|nr:HAMP domain-containing sensor histidine kinase [Kineosporia sp. A_224]